ncbi:MAG: glutamyl-tRNA reductase [Micrococcaceae bacterium]
MNLLSFIASHKTGELNDIEKVSHHSELIAPQLTSRPDLIAGCITLCTCNRFEVYVETNPECDTDDAIEYVFSVIAEANGSEENFVKQTLTVLQNQDVINHLYKVAATLDSMAIGEREIVGQVRTALKEAQFQRTTSPQLELAFQQALKVGKKVATKTGLTSTGRSLVDVAVEMALDSCKHEIQRTPTWGNNSALIIGTGAYAGATVATLRNSGCTNINVYSHSGRAKKFALSHDIHPVSKHNFIDAISEAQVVVACSGSGPIMTVNMVQEALDKRKQRSPLTFIDMALRHDIHQLVGLMKNVELINLETIQSNISPEHSEEIDKAKKLVHTASQEFKTLAKTRNLNNTVLAVRERAHKILAKELDKLPENPSKKETEQAMRRLTNALLHVPTKQAKKLTEAGKENDYIDGVKAVYDLDI